MNKKQWNTFAIGSWVFSVLIGIKATMELKFAGTFIGISDILYSSYHQIAHMYEIMSAIVFVAGWLFLICGGFENNGN